MHDIEAVFTTREQAINTKDQILYESTQLNSPTLWTGIFNGYRSVKGISIEILTQADEEADFSKYVFAKEVCQMENGTVHIKFTMYGLIHTVKGWKISSIASSPMPFDYPSKSKQAKKRK